MSKFLGHIDSICNFLSLMQEFFFLLIYPCLRSWGFILFWSLESERAKDVPPRHLQNSMSGVSDKPTALKDLKLISYKKKQKLHHL